MTLSLHVLSSPTLALMSPTTMSASCRGVILIFLKFIIDLLLCIFWWCIIGNHCQFSKIRVRSSQDQYVADWFPVKQGFVHFSIHNHGYSSSVLVLCLSRIKNGLYRGRSLYQVYPACLTHARKFDVVTFYLPQYFLKPSCSIECSHSHLFSAWGTPLSESQLPIGFVWHFSQYCIVQHILLINYCLTRAVEHNKGIFPLRLNESMFHLI